jgi:hypothetical protein
LDSVILTTAACAGIDGLQKDSKAVEEAHKRISKQVATATAAVETRRLLDRSHDKFAASAVNEELLSIDASGLRLRQHILGLVETSMALEIQNTFFRPDSERCPRLRPGMLKEHGVIVEFFPYIPDLETGEPSSSFVMLCRRSK